MKYLKSTITGFLPAILPVIFLMSFASIGFAQVSYLDFTGLTNSNGISNVNIGSTGETFSATITTEGSPISPTVSSNGDFVFRMGDMADVQCLNLTFSAGMQLFLTQESTERVILNKRDSLYISNTNNNLIDPDDNIQLRTVGDFTTFVPKVGITNYSTWSLTFSSATTIQIYGRRHASSPSRNLHIPIRIGISQSTTLPVELVDFTSMNFETYRQFDWQTASEVNNDFFTLERSKDGQNWENIDIVKGNGTTLTGKSYSTIDYSPLSGRSYYRLKQTDFDGAYEYSKVLTIKGEDHDPNAALKLSAFPNPCSNVITIPLEGSSLEKIKVVNSNGQYFTNAIIHLGKGKYDTSALSPGVYYFKIGTESLVVLKD